MTMPAVALLLFVLALFLFWHSARQYRESGLPGGRIIYTDTHAWRATPQPLYDSLLGLSGKPDYLIDTGETIIPVEVKTGRTPTAPYDAHIFQVAAYCLLVERTAHKRPPYGILHYPERDFAIDYTPQLESALLDILADMRRAAHRQEVHRSHADPKRCARCGFRQRCEERL
jgi:CRISPR-associated exonuclease Cas4